MQNRHYISIVAGIIIAGAFIFIFETIGKLMYPSTYPIDFSSLTIEGRNIISEQMPFMAKVIALIGNAVGAFVAAAIATFISGRKEMKPMLAVETVLFSFAVLKMLVIPFPIWFWILTPAAFFGLGYVTYRFLKKKEELEGENS